MRKPLLIGFPTGLRRAYAYQKASSLFLAVFNARSDERSAINGLFGNLWLWASVGLSLLLHAAVIYIPVLQQAFSTVGVGAKDWLICAGVASSVLWLRELSKIIHRARI